MTVSKMFTSRVSLAIFSCLAVTAVLAVTPAMAVCGNSIVEPGEDCDDGGSNGSTNSCCNASCFFSGKAPDVVVGELTGVTRYGNVGGITAYAVGTTSCNLGSCWLKWISGTAEHPVIGQNMFRLANGRFEQVGQSWLKHGFTALQGTVCSTSCVPSGTGTRLGVNCSDPYGSSLNGSQTNLGPKDDVNASSGVFPYPDSRISTTGDAIFKRLQIHDVDIDPSLNPGALYFVEGQYVTKDDADSKNQNNNASYRPAAFSVGGFPPIISLALTGSTVRQKSGIQAWKATDPSVTETLVDAPEGRFILSAKATPLGGGIYHYEYALQNLNNNRAGQSFTVPIPPGTVVTNVGFHDVDYHSGTPYVGTDWTSTVTATSVSWATQTSAQNPNANALRWGTLYNFRFDADVAPGTSLITLGLFRPGVPMSVTKATVTPGPCGGAANGTACDDRNPCTQTDSCQAGACVGSNPVACTPLDACHDPGICDPATGVCSNPAKLEGAPCIDGDACTTVDVCLSGFCVGSNPVVCTASDPCHDPGTCDSLTGACTDPPSADGTPCDDGNACTLDDACVAGTCSASGTGLPGDVGDGVRMSQLEGVTTVTWDAAPDSTTSAVLRGLLSQLPVGPGDGDEVCLDTGVVGSSITDADVPPQDDAFWYLIQGRSSCGEGTYGAQSVNGVQDTPRVSTTCP